ncbi:MAG: helix-turn-helix transcriptional regulator [Bacteroidales bacterium]|nr:helix-turn-helix transcriptional regulator [Bacteroidales bacterium]
MALSDHIYNLMVERGLSKTEFANAICKRPCEITKWLSGQHNFTIKTLAKLYVFFGEPLIDIK